MSAGWRRLIPGLWAWGTRNAAASIFIAKDQPHRPEGVFIEIPCNPETGTSWKSMKEAREWISNKLFV